MKTMLEQLKKDPNKITSLSRNEMMHILLRSWELLQIDTQREFKSLFVTNPLDGSEDCSLSDKLVGDEMVIFKKKFMTSQPAKTLKEVIPKLISPKGIEIETEIEMLK